MNGFDLTGKVALVTGAASGIGKATVERMTEFGATAVGVDITAGASYTLDVTDRDAVFTVVEHVVAEHGRLDVMANVAGVFERRPMADVTEDELDRILAVNLKGVLHGCQAAVGAMKDGGSIINVASGAVDTGAPGTGAYAISKAGVVQLTRVLASEVGRQGIRVNAVAPGYIETPMTQAADGGGALELMRKYSPLGLVGEPDDVAYAIVYLASDASRFMTGQIIRPNGGTTMPW